MCLFLYFLVPVATQSIVILPSMNVYSNLNPSAYFFHFLVQHQTQKQNVLHQVLFRLNSFGLCFVFFEHHLLLEGSSIVITLEIFEKKLKLELCQKP